MADHLTQEELLNKCFANLYGSYPIEADFQPDPEDGSPGLATCILDVLREAESAAYKRGAEAMRERAAQALDEMAKQNDQKARKMKGSHAIEELFAIRDECRMAAVCIRALTVEEPKP